jgi:iron complex outermembrane receptor protein
MRVQRPTHRVPFALSLLALAAGQTLAQQAPTEAVQEITVTATRVTTTAQKTAVSLSVYRGEALAEQGIGTVDALQGVDSSINLTKSGGVAYVAVRGVASTDTTETGDPSVSIARDGFFTNRSFGINAGFYDVDRIEVLKGPQGTLFGRNSTGGLINILSARPTKDREGYIQLGLGNYGARNVEGAFNTPLGSAAQLRVSGTSRQRDGFRHVSLPDGSVQRGDDEDTRSLRVQLAFQPLPGLTGLVALQADRVGGVGDLSKQYTLATVSPVGDAQTFSNYAPTIQEVVSDRLRWELNYDRLPGDWTLSYQGGVDRSTWKHRLDATADVTNPAGYPAIRQLIQSESPDTSNHEIRFSSPQNGPLTAQFGYFRFSENNTIDSGIFNLSMLNPPPGSFDYSGQYGIKFDYEIQTRSSGLFGQAGWQLNPSVKLTFGARRTSEKKERTGNAQLIIGALANPFVPLPVAPVTPGNGSTDESKTTVLLGADWVLSADNFLYAKYATGFKAGGFNSNGASASVPYGPETVGSFEIGSKNRFMNRQLQLNATAFIQNYKGYQASQTTDVLSGGGVFNVGNAKIRGVEMDTVANVAGVARFNAAATLLSTKFGDGIVIRDASGANVDISGKRLPNAPKLVITAGAERAFGLLGGSLTARVYGKYSSDYYFSVSNTPDESSPSVTTANLLFTYAPDAGDWQASFYVDNVTDKVVLANARRNYNSNWNSVQFQPPRTYGVRVRYAF